MKEQFVVEKEVTLSEIWHVVYTNKLIVILIVSLFAISSIFYSISLPNLYRSEVKLMSAGESAGGLSSLAGGLGGLASMAGISLPGGGGEKTALALEVLQSRMFLTDFVNKYKILVPLIAGKGTNDKGEIIINNKLYDSDSNKWIRAVIAPKPVIPSSEDIFVRFKQIMVVNKASKNGIINITLEFFDPKIAQYWLTLLVKEINLAIKERDKKEAEQSITYLKGTIQDIENATTRQAFYQIIEEQMRTLLMTNVRDEYVFKVIDPATFPEVKASPKRALICIIATLAGFVLALMFVLIRHFNAKKD
ncbi:GNVR domain-containing protein [Cognaticolwellia mytili]|uniref:GNVR domain-containing protein n=1 Tax=Cognaticolwellia mytili TaxID=1888913 RepID=UPI000A170E32|nr:GNVR domain-containing protein [Cognaticolwellia mytili]